MSEITITTDEQSQYSKINDGHKPGYYLSADGKSLLIIFGGQANGKARKCAILREGFEFPALTNTWCLKEQYRQVNVELNFKATFLSNECEINV